jgi:hypothetical protein
MVMVPTILLIFTYEMKQLMGIKSMNRVEDNLFCYLSIKFFAKWKENSTMPLPIYLILPYIRSMAFFKLYSCESIS